jgi:hypothetical protein
MKKRRPFAALALVLLAIATIPALLVAPAGMRASSHREAPITALDPKADITDLWAFRSYDINGNDTNPASITIIMGVDPFAEPANGPNWFPFDPTILYQVHIDNNNDALDDVTFQFRFTGQFQLPTVYTALAGFTSSSGGGAVGVPPQITDFSNPGVNLRQTYSVTMVKNGVSTRIVNADGSPFFAVPANAGPRTMKYSDLYAAGTYTSTNQGISLFSGTVDDPFFIDLGGAFDTGNFHTGPSGIPGVMNTGTEPPGTATDGANGRFAADTVSGYAVNVLALQVPITMLTSTGQIEPSTSPHATIGVWGSTSRQGLQVKRPSAVEVGAMSNSSSFHQIQRLGNPLINELIIGTGTKDFWSMSLPVNDSQFAASDLNPLFVTIVDSLYSVLVPNTLFSPPAPRNDLLPLVEYLPPIAATGTVPGPIADLLRLNTGVLPTAPGKANRLGVLLNDGAGYPNGRRLADDVVDITLRAAVGGVLAGNLCGPNHNTSCNVFPNNVLGDGVNINDVNVDLAPDGVTNLVEPNTHFHTSFPYVDYCPSGRDRQHIDPGDPGCSINPNGICSTN